ncbi:MAG: hypothetical protein KIT25_07035 [Enhydrobacter sp.]|nr:MAG: hypothetical protein KIT25_07035 [Enhydrobacter sp.]
MKLVSSLHGRAMQGFNPDEARSHQSTYLPTAVDMIKARYGFLTNSDLRTSADAGVKFQSGRLQRQGEAEIAIENLDVYNDGLLVVCRTTTEADIVLDDVISWGQLAFQVRQPASPPPRLYSSWLVVDFDEPIAKLVAKFAIMKGLITAAHERAYGMKLDFQFHRVSFNVDPSTLPLHTFTDYAMDRRGGAPYALNRFFCTAPLKTEEHIQLLSEIEANVLK